MTIAVSFSHAQQTVQVVWPFSPSSSNAAMIHNLIESANSQQSKYQFVFVNKPGAGGSIAANTVSESKNLTVLISTTSFYVRPTLFQEAHNFEQFSLINEFCTNQPLGVFSTKIKKISSESVQPTIGIIPGSITNLVSKAIMDNNPHLKLIEVGYKGTPEATTDMLGGHVDASVDFTGPSVTQRFTGSVNVLGITGTKDRKGMKTFQSQGIKGLDQLTHGHYVFVRSDVRTATKLELSSIINSAYSNHAKITEICEQDGGTLNAVPFNKLEQLNQDNIRSWTIFTKGIAKQ